MSAEEFLKIKQQFNDNELNYNYDDPAYLRLVYPQKSKPKKKKSLKKDNKVSKEINNVVKISEARNKLLKPQNALMFLILGSVIGIAMAFKKLSKGETDSDTFETPYFPEKDEKSKIKNKIIAEAERQGVDPNLALAVAEQESNFNQSSKSDKGAVGIMQLTPIACQQMGVDFEKVKTDTDLNIKTGVAYLKWCLKNTNNEKEALVAYNAGIGNLNKAKKSGKDIDSITNNGNYAKSVLERKQKFKEIAPKNLQKGMIDMGNYALKNDKVELSSTMKKYLSEINHNDYFVVSSGMEKITKHKGTANDPKSHYSGNKVDIRVWDVNDEKLIERIVNFLKHPATKTVALEFEDERKADRIIQRVTHEYPLAKGRITKYKLAKGNGNHLDILIDPNYYNPKSLYNKANKFIEKAKEIKREIKEETKPETDLFGVPITKNVNINLKSKKPNIIEPYITKLNALDTIRNSNKNYKKF